MIPLRDNIPHSRPPYVNYGIIGFTLLVFTWELDLGSRLPQLAGVLGFVPARFLARLWSDPLGWPGTVLPLFTSQFLHGSWLHLLANMWFLFIFGDNVEDILGHGSYLVFYLACGAGANLIYLLFASASNMPVIGASGAVAEVMGAYFNLFPGARILTLFIVIFIPLFLELPAYFFLGLWFLLQFLYGTFTTLGTQAGREGVAWWAHVGGFIVGIGLLHLLAPQRVRSIFRRG